MGKRIIDLPPMVASQFTGEELMEVSENGLGSYRSSLGGAGIIAITRGQIPTTTIVTPTFITNGYSTPGDEGAGAMYTSNGATSLGMGAIQDAAGTWFNLIVEN